MNKRKINNGEEYPLNKKTNFIKYISIKLNFLLDHVIKLYQEIVIHNKFHFDYVIILTIIKLIHTVR